MDPLRATEALLAVIEEDRLRRCQACGDEARQQAAQLRGEARLAARQRVREALAVERRRLRDGLAAVDAALATELRLHDQRAFRALLEKTWERMPAVLAARWADPECRAAWARHVIESARGALPAGDWTIVHGPGWPGAERERLAQSLAAREIAVAFQEDPGFGPGLEVRSRGNRVDGTAAGLAADEGEVGARLLECLAALAPEARP